MFYWRTLENLTLSMKTPTRFWTISRATGKTVRWDSVVIVAVGYYSESCYWLMSSTFHRSLERGILQIGGCHLIRTITEALSKTIESSTFLSEIDLSDTFLSRDCFELILQGLTFNKSITRVNLSGNQIEGILVLIFHPIQCDPM
jgi:hypothetical protein